MVGNQNVGFLITQLIYSKDCGRINKQHGSLDRLSHDKRMFNSLRYNQVIEKKIDENIIA